MLARLAVIAILNMVLVLGAAADATACARKLMVGWEEWTPYQEMIDSQHGGLDTELLNLIMTEAGCTVAYVEQPWDRQLEALRQGTLDMVVGASHTEERAEYTHFSLPYRGEIIAVFGRVGELDGLNSLQDIKDRDLRVIVERGFFIGKAFEDIKKDLRLLEVRGHDESIRALDAGLADVAIGDMFTGRKAVWKMGLGARIVVHLRIYTNVDVVHFGFSKKSVNPEDVAKINGAIQRLKDQGALNPVIQKYGSWVFQTGLMKLPEEAVDR